MNRVASRADAGTSEFRRLFLNHTPFIDTRAPVEFAKGALPGSTNLPLMSDQERAAVGTCYKHQGQDAAVALGHSLVCGEIKAQRVNAWVEFAQRNPQGYLYCWRGGLRSQICQQWLHQAGCVYPRVAGGYKAMRRFLIQEFERICAQQPMLLLAGRTGCNKTALINALPHAVDLEGLANHLGSSFGRLPSGQPTQLSFENALAVALLKTEQGLTSAREPIILEDESRTIGRCGIPTQLLHTMKASPIVLLEAPLEERIQHTHRNYILRRLTDWQTLAGEAAGFDAFANDLTQSLLRLRNRLGGVRHQQIAKLLAQALEAHRAGDVEPHRAWITSLLVNYYDPMYDYQLAAKTCAMVFRGNRTEVRDYLLSTEKTKD